MKERHLKLVPPIMPTWPPRRETPGEIPIIETAADADAYFERTLDPESDTTIALASGDVGVSGYTSVQLQGLGSLNLGNDPSDIEGFHKAVLDVLREDAHGIEGL